jgi:hypothetical protein
MGEKTARRVLRGEKSCLGRSLGRLSHCEGEGEANRLSIAVSLRNFTSSIPDVDLTFAN